jgi:lipoprotein-anchoring transpeptidase ErfK/SrfK
LFLVCCAIWSYSIEKRTCELQRRYTVFFVQISTFLGLVFAFFCARSLAAQTLQVAPAPTPLVFQLPVSVSVKNDHTVVRLKPTRRSKRRGVVMRGTRLGVLEKTEGFGCRGYWYRVHSDAWICGDQVTPSSMSSWGLDFPVVPPGKLTPWPYGFVREPAIEYNMRRGFLEEIREVQKGFGFGVEGRVNIEGHKFFRTAEGSLIPREAAGISGRISKYTGVRITRPDEFPVGFVNARVAHGYSEPKKGEKFRIGKVQRYKPFHVLEEFSKGKRRFYKIDENAWLFGDDVRVATKAEMPKDLEPNERWIDVDTKQQILTAYQGSTPVYVSLISSGRYGPARTVKGEYRIWAKVSAIAMDNTDEELEGEVTDAGPPTDEHHIYSLHDVPWTQFFFESYALHGVYWHDRFGNRRSHGCVNLSPVDARWLYNWTSPQLPSGWWAIHESPNDKGTLVRVR